MKMVRLGLVRAFDTVGLRKAYYKGMITVLMGWRRRLEEVRDVVRKIPHAWCAAQMLGLAKRSNRKGAASTTTTICTCILFQG